MKCISTKSNTYFHTIEIGKYIASRLKSGDIITLNGDLGAGKTALTKGICDFFGVQNISSPTFAIMNVYEFIEINNINTIYHFDAYRLDQNSWADGGFSEFLYEKNAISIVEWANNINLVGDIDIKISYEVLQNPDYNENHRIISIKGLSDTEKI